MRSNFQFYFFVSYSVWFCSYLHKCSFLFYAISIEFLLRIFNYIRWVIKARLNLVSKGLLTIRLICWYVTLGILGIIDFYLFVFFMFTITLISEGGNSC